MATAHLIHGYLGVGKTTFARELAGRVGAVLFDLDEWYLELFAPRQPTPHLDADALDRLWRQLNRHWPTLLEHGVDVVLDFGFWTRARRDEARNLAAAVGAEAVLYAIECDDAVALARCLARNDDPRGSFLIDEAAYRTLRDRFDPLAEDEQRVPLRT